MAEVFGPLFHDLVYLGCQASGSGFMPSRGEIRSLHGVIGFLSYYFIHVTTKGPFSLAHLYSSPIHMGSVPG